ncbi:MAG: FeoA family protein [Bacillota bacterium]
MRQSATSFTSLLGNRLGLVGPSHHASQDAIQTETPGSSCLTPLPDATTDCPVFLANNEANGLLKQKLVDLGFIAGTPLRLIRRGPKGNLIAVRLRNTVIALRSEEARSLLVAPATTSLTAKDE